MSTVNPYQYLVRDIEKNIRAQIDLAVCEALKNQPIAVMSIETFSELSGVGVCVVRSWIGRGYIPTIKIGKRRLINHAALTAECLQSEAM